MKNIRNQKCEVIDTGSDRYEMIKRFVNLVRGILDNAKKIRGGREVVKIRSGLY